MRRKKITCWACVEGERWEREAREGGGDNGWGEKEGEREQEI